MTRKTALLALAVLCVVGGEAGFLLAGGPQAYDLNATLVPTSDGRLEFHLDSAGTTGRMLFNVALAKLGSGGQSYTGKLTANPGGPPFCSCPDAANTCQCIVQPSELQALLR